MTSACSEQVVNAQFLAFNARDLDQFLTHYAPDAEMYAHPSRLIASGHSELSRYFAARFQDSRLNSALLERMVMDSYVIDHERITRTFDAGPGIVELLASYEVGDAKIRRCWLNFGAEILA